MGFRYYLILMLVIVSSIASATRLNPQSEYATEQTVYSINSIGNQFIVAGERSLYYFHTPLDYIWNKTLDDRIAVAHVSDENILISTVSQELILLNQSADVLWTLKLPSYVGYESAIHVGAERVIVGTMDGLLYYINMGGEVMWNYSTDSYIIEVFSQGGNILVVSDRAYYILSEEGTLVDDVRFQSYIVASHIAGDEFTVSTGDGTLYHLRKDGGDVFKKYFGNMVGHVTTNDELIAVGTHEGVIHVFDKTGILKWKRQVNGSILSLKLSESALVTSTSSNHLYVFSQHGVLRRDFITGKQIQMILLRGKNIIAVNSDGVLLLLDMPEKSKLDNLLTLAIILIGAIISAYILLKSLKA